jgi:hypothetical protein
MGPAPFAPAAAPGSSYSGAAAAHPAKSANGANAAGAANPLQIAPGGRAAGVGEMIEHLSTEIQRLRVDFERFFSGALPIPPEEQRNRVQTHLRYLRSLNAGSAVDRFRIGDLEARFNSYNELFNRRLRDREEGRKRLPAAAPPAEAAAPRYDPAAGIVFGQRIDQDAVAALYNGLAAGAAGGEGPRFDLASFGSYLQRQAAAIRERTGCDEVQFRLASEDGKLKLKARPARGQGPRS